MTTFDSWESYKAEPNGLALKNLWGYTDRDIGKLEQREYRETAARQAEILTGRVQIPHTYDADHVRAIHKHLFQNVYEWAGEYRTVNMAKQGNGFSRTGDIDVYLTHARRLVGSVDWAKADKQEFAEGAAKVFALVNQAHPFREGNGRTSKVFMAHVAEMSQFTIDYSRVSPERWNAASAEATPPITEAVPDWQTLVPVFRDMAVERDGAPPREPIGEPVERDASASSFPASAVHALRAARYTREPESRVENTRTASSEQKGYER